MGSFEAVLGRLEFLGKLIGPRLLPADLGFVLFDEALQDVETVGAHTLPSLSLELTLLLDSLLGALPLLRDLLALLFVHGCEGGHLSPQVSVLRPHLRG